MPENTATPNTLVLKSSQKGYVDTYIFCAVWFVLFVIFNIWGWHYLNTIYAKYRISSIFMIDLHDEIPVGTEFLAVVAFLGKWVGGIAALVVVFSIAYTAIYSTRRVTALCGKSISEETTAPTITINTWYFFWKENQETEAFDGFVTILVDQGFWDKIFNTGTITLLTIAYMHTKERKQTWVIPAIANPHEVKAWILANIPRYGYGTQLQLN